jgi:sugar lactone lactonase YvrE
MLLAYHPSNGSTIALMDKLWFGNGVALSPEEDYLLVADSIQMKIHRCNTGQAVNRIKFCMCIACGCAVAHTL